MQETNMLDELSNFIFLSKYSRYNDKLQRRETWGEAVDRLLNMHLKKFNDKLTKKDLEEVIWAFSLMRGKKVIASMRSLQFGGKGVEAHNARMFNCCVRHVDSIRSFAEGFYLLLCGCGFGIGLSKHFLGRFPDLVDSNNKTGTVLSYCVEDNIEGWADSIEALLNCYFKNNSYTGRKIVFDYSKIRKKGTLLKTGGGKAPGYQGLKHCHVKVKELLDSIIEDQGQKRLKSIDAYDILMHCADAVLSGGVRRSATCVIFEKDDEDMLNSKTYFSVDRKQRFIYDEDEKQYCGKVVVRGKKYEVGLSQLDYDILQKDNKISWVHVEPQRARSNNSVLLLREEVSKEEFTRIVQRTKEFGEPGFVFANHNWQLLNPCQPAFATVLTPEGIKNFGDIKLGDQIWSESGWTNVVNKVNTGIKPVYKYGTTGGSFIGTENHRVVSGGEKIEAKDADSLDVLKGPALRRESIELQAVMDGLMIGDGSIHLESKDKVYLIIGDDDIDYFRDPIADLIREPHAAKKENCYKVVTTISHEELPKTWLREVPDRYFYANMITKISFLRGLYSANGSLCGNRVTLKATSFKIIEQVQIMLSSLGISSYYTTNKPSWIEWDNGTYESKQSYDLNISSDRIKFFNNIGFIQEYKQEELERIINSIKQSPKPQKKTYDIKETKYLGDFEVFDITVDNDTHTYWTGGVNVSNCFEVSFIPVTEDGVCGTQMCNLTSINGAKVKSKEDFKDCVKAATIIGTLQATYTDFPYLSKTAKTLTEEEALLGVSITGMMDSPEILLNPRIQRNNARYAVSINKVWSEKLGIKQAARVTLVKPEGTSSLVLGCGSGIHPHHAHKYIRRVQCNKIDPVYKFFKKNNPHMCEDSVWSSTKTDDVISFPIDIPNTSKVKEDLTALKHLKLIKCTQRNWVVPGTSDSNKKPIVHNVSCTVIVKDNEWKDVIEYLYKNRVYFSAVALISDSGDKLYKQAPNEKIVSEGDVKNFNELLSKYNKVDYLKLKESDDETHLQQEISCAGGKCDLI